MSTMSIEWHTKCLNNLRLSLDRKEAEIIKLENEFKRDMVDYGFYLKQIGKAKSMGKDSFDSEKFMKKERP